MSVAPEPAPGKAELPPHLLLGLDCATAVRFLKTELPEPWNKIEWLNREDSYKSDLPRADVRAIRNDYPESLFWIAADPGKFDRLTGYDLAEAIKAWLRKNNAEGKSVCEVLKERGWDIDEPEVFLSHVQAETPTDTLDAMHRIDKRIGAARRGTKHTGSKIWVDYFCLRQLQNDFKTEQVVQLIGKTGAVYVYMDGKDTGCSYPKRSFCVFESSVAIESGATLMILSPHDGPLSASQSSCWPCCICWCPLPDYTIDAAAATARRADDKAKVDKYIEEGPGFARVNQMMERELRRSAVKSTWFLANIFFCLPCMAMATCFYEFCPRCPNPFGCFLECSG